MSETEHYRDGSGWEETAGYSRAVRRGDHILVSGTTAPGDGVRAQTTEAIRRALAAVEALGGSGDDVVRTRIYLVPGADWEEAAAAHMEALGQVSPANTTLFVHGLIGGDFLVEVEVEAWLLS
jgi:enamine deaminase RidA (YjgF/YER057c/UK114 family)